MNESEMNESKGYLILVESIAKEFHTVYDKNAPDYGCKTRGTSRVPWEDVPAAKKTLMMMVIDDLLARDVIRKGCAGSYGISQSKR